MHGCCLLCVIWAGIVGFATRWILNRDLRFCRLFPRVYVWVYGHSLQTVFTKSSPARRHTLEILPRKGRPVNCANMTGRLMNIFKTLKNLHTRGKGVSVHVYGGERQPWGVCLHVCVFWVEVDCACDMNKAVCLYMYICSCAWPVLLATVTFYKY